MSSVRSLTGQTIGQYEVREMIGQGGMGAVYNGFQTLLRRSVALKVLPERLASDEISLERFTREARTIAALEHPHIVPVYDFGTTSDGLSYIVMRLLNGGSLARRLPQPATFAAGNLPSLAEIADMLRALASALDYAHSQGVVHRDIKPSNVMFDERGTPFLVDFGIAKLTNQIASTALTGEDVFAGTAMYMAPEQWRGDAISGATDQYALAAVIYQLVTGRPPFEASTPYALMHRHLTEAVKPVQEFRRAAPEALNDVFSRALAKDPTQRYPTASDFAGAFAQAIADVQEQPTQFFTTPIAKTSTAAPDVDAITNIDLISKVEHAPAVKSASPRSSSNLLVYYVVAGLAALVAAYFALTNAGAVPIIVAAVIVAGAVGLATARSRRTMPSTARSTPAERPARQRSVSDSSKPAPQPSSGREATTPDVTQAASQTSPPPVTTRPTPPPASPRATQPATPAPSVRSMSSLKLGDKIGRYELVKRLDTGDRNRVYRVRDTKRGHDVAMKLLGLGEASDTRSKRFAQEAQILGALHNPHIIPFLDFDTVDGLSFIVMPLLEGGTLRDKLQVGVMNSKQVMQVLHEVGDALEYLHGEKIIHRDLKDTNILFDKEGNTYLVDFGIAKLQNDQNPENLTMTGQVVGTPSYIAPEQWVGMDITPAVDQYSLGILTFQMLTGEVPFDGPAPAALLYKHLYETPPSITTMRRDLNPVVDSVMLKVLAKKPDDRYASIRQYVDALGAAMAGIRENSGATSHIFISYGREDQDYARKLAGHIEKSGFQVWIDDRIDYGDRWFKEIEDAICASGAFVIVMTPDSNESEWVNREILLARREKKPIFPLLLRGREFGMLIDVQYVDVTSGSMPPKAFYERLERELHKP